MPCRRGVVSNFPWKNGRFLRKRQPLFLGKLSAFSAKVSGFVRKVRLSVFSGAGVSPFFFPDSVRKERSCFVKKSGYDKVFVLSVKNILLRGRIMDGEICFMNLFAFPCRVLLAFFLTGVCSCPGNRLSRFGIVIMSKCQSAYCFSRKKKYLCEKN